MYIYTMYNNHNAYASLHTYAILTMYAASRRGGPAD